MLMKKPLKFLPGFKATCLTVCILYIILTGGLFAQGLMHAMGSYQVPQATLDSPHYYNAIFWVYSEMLVMGLMIGAIGLLVKEAKAQIWLSRLLCATQAFFTWLDASASDSALGNGLYKGPASLMPAVICLVVTLLFLHLSFGKADAGQQQA
jgi:hypothetical protein